MEFKRKLTSSWRANNSLLCVGLDPDLTKLPAHIQKASKPFYVFNTAIIDATADLVCAYKLNSAMYEAAGSSGITQLKQTFDYLRATYPSIPTILDFKRGDIGNSNTYYAQFAFDYLGADAITIQPYLGKEANEAYLAYKNKGIFVLCRTSNPGAGEFQDLKIDCRRLFEHVAKVVTTSWNMNNNCGLVVGSTYPEEQAAVRALVGDDVVLLIPGVGTQGGDIAKTITASLNRHKTGVIINSSREVIYADTSAKFSTGVRAKALALRDEINRYRNKE